MKINRYRCSKAAQKRVSGFQGDVYAPDVRIAEKVGRNLKEPADPTPAIRAASWEEALKVIRACWGKVERGEEIFLS